jgi:hypothetical protein
VDDPVGFEWTTYAALLTPPFTIELVFTAADTNGYRKIFGYEDAVDNGWYLVNGYFTSYNNSPSLTAGYIGAGAPHYLAIVGATQGNLDVYVDGVFAGATGTFATPPLEAIFFRDDGTGASPRPEHLAGAVDAVRFSSVARTELEIAIVQARLAGQ